MAEPRALELAGQMPEEGPVQRPFRGGKTMLGKRMIRIVTQCTLALVFVAATTACGRAMPRRQNGAENNQVLFLGDSIFALSFGIERNLEGRFGTFRSFTASGARLEVGGFAPSITSQFASAERVNSNTAVVVMNGGGNDLLFPVLLNRDPQDCLTPNPNAQLSRACQQLLTQIQVDLTDFLNALANSGVRNVLYLGYYYTKNAAPGGISNNAPLGQLRQAVDFAAMALDQACDRVQGARQNFTCQFLDSRTLIQPTDIVADGIHPAQSGSDKLANLIAGPLEPLL